MLFTNWYFVVFLAICVIGFYLLKPSLRKYWILIFSMFFYGSFGTRYFLALVLIIAVTFLGGCFTGKSHKHKKLIYGVSMAACVLILVVFKYTNFVISSLNAVNEKIHLLPLIDIPDIFVPVGVSFIILRACSYVGDIYHDRLKDKSFISCAVYISFFPIILSGPIQKARDAVCQYEFKVKPDVKRIESGALLFCYGMFCKLFVADRIAVITDKVFSAPTMYSGLPLILAALLFSIQIYADFSSYSDIAIGISRMLGVHIDDNFKAPFLTRSVAEFWRRWHISLSDWLTEYVYYPLGGSKKGTVRKYINVLIVFLVSGLWHGASWTFVLWGLINGIYQVVGQLTGKYRIALRKKLGFEEDNRVIIVLQRIGIFIAFSSTWFLFKNDEISVALGMYKSIFAVNPVRFLDASSFLIFENTVTALFTVAYAAVFLVLQVKRQEKGRLYADYLSSPQPVKLFIVTFVCIFMVVGYCMMMANPATNFVYFKF